LIRHKGQEIQKTGPAIVVSTEFLRAIPMRIIIPITGWQAKFSDRPFIVNIPTTPATGLDRESAGNVLQVRSLSTERFSKRLGFVSSEMLNELLAGLIICVDYEPRS
jgi:mRNA interferase MazF